VALVWVGLVQLRKTRHTQDSPAVPETEPALAAVKPCRPSFDVPQFFSRLSNRFRACAVRPRRRRARLLLFFVACEVISRIRLPAALRYSFLYRNILGATLFGLRGQRGHPLQRLLSMPFFVTRRSFFVAPFFLRATLSKPVLFLLIGAFILSSRLRRNAFRGSARLIRAAYMRFGDSELAGALREIPWKEYAAVGIEQAEIIARKAIAALIAFSQALEQIGESRDQSASGQPAAESVPAQAQPQETAYDTASVESYEMVPPSAAEESTSTLRARVTRADEDD